MSKRSIKALTLSLFLITTSMGIANPIVPLYAKDLGATYTDLGLIGVAWSAPYCFFPALAGLWSDRIGRLKVFLVGVLTSIVVPLLLLASRSPLDIALVRLFHGVGLSFLWVAGEALISDVTKEEERARHLGLFNALWAMGYFIGPMISASTIERAGYAGIFWLSFYVGLTSPLALLLAEGGVKLGQTARGDVVSRVKEALSKGSALYLAVTASSIVISIIYSVYPAYLRELCFTDSEVSFVVGVVAAARAAGFWSTTVIPGLSERRAVYLGLSLQTIASLFIVFVRDPASAALAVAMAGYAIGVLVPASTSAISRTLGKEFGLTLGIMESMFGVGWVIGPGVGGILADYSSWSSSPYLFMALVSVTSLAYFAARSRYRVKD
jgi:DHA1 family multidrug resistance protein-like MFS transporter/DHA1 family quinolone resistance protein-like MFS transporter